MYEIECKYRVADPAALEASLAGRGVILGSPVVQVDLYLSHPARDFAQTDEALRLRRTGDEVRVTYKGPKLDRATKTRREIELPLTVDGPHSPDQIVTPDQIEARWREFFEAIGFRASVEVRKRRRSGHLAWQGWEVEFSLDDVDRLGLFVEIEIVAEQERLSAARDAVQQLAASLGLSNPELRGYAQMLPRG